MIRSRLFLFFCSNTLFRHATYAEQGFRASGSECRYLVFRVFGVLGGGFRFKFGDQDTRFWMQECWAVAAGSLKNDRFCSYLRSRHMAKGKQQSMA